VVTASLRAAEPERDFGQLAAWFSSLEDEPTSEVELRTYYEEQKQRIVQTVAEDEHGKLLGFCWAVRDRLVPDRAYFHLFVEPEQRKQGVGSRLYEWMVHTAATTGAKRLRVSIWDTCPESRAFAERRGFTELRHRIAMALDLDAFDDRPYDEVISRLKSEGFLFSSMEALGDTEEAQRKLYALNSTTSIETPGSDGEPPWESLEDFQSRVCQSDWYKPAGQMVVIDTAAGVWAAMSAITRLEGRDYAYNLHTGVDRRYRGRKLGQAVKVIALRYARDVLKAHAVRTHHNTMNLPMIAIDRKLGYALMPGTFLMEKANGGQGTGPGSYDDNAFVAECYDHVVPYRERADAPFYVEAARESGGPVLELGCGTGRVLIPTARAGVEAVGLDSSEHMLRVCRTRLAEEPGQVASLVTLTRGDMRDFSLGRSFRLITMPFRSFQHLLTVEEQLSCLACVKRHLTTDGRLVFDVFNPSLELLTSDDIGEEKGHEPEFTMPDGSRVTRCYRLVSRDAFQQRNVVELVHYVAHPDGRRERLVHAFPMRYLFRFELEHLLARSGLGMRALYAGFDKQPYGSTYPGDLVVVAGHAGERGG